jgi:hypothetical protein
MLPDLLIHHESLHIGQISVWRRAAGLLGVTLPEFATVEVHAPTLPYLGPDRRMGKERREPGMRGQTLFNGADRRANPFGRRHMD